MLYLLIFAFGAGGAISRYAVGLWMPHFTGTTSFPYATLAVNYTGTLVLIWLSFAARFQQRWNKHVQEAVTTGFIGAYTTFSVLSWETTQMLAQHRWLAAFLYLMLSLWGGLLFAWLGYKLATASRRERAAG